MKLYSEESLKRIIGVYLQGWLDEAYRLKNGLGQTECAYYSLAYSSEMERSLQLETDFSVIAKSDLKNMIHSGIEFALELNLHDRAAHAIADDSEEEHYLESLQDLVWERDKLQCFIDQVSKHLRYLKSEDLQNELNNVVSDALYFDYLFLEEHPMLAALLAEGNQWFFNELASVPLPSNAWWFYKQLGLRRSEKDGTVSLHDFTFLEENLFYLCRLYEIKSACNSDANKKLGISSTFSVFPMVSAFIGATPRVAADSRHFISKVALLPGSLKDLRFPLRSIPEDLEELGEVYAILETQPVKDDQGKCYAQWRLKGKDLPVFTEGSFHLADIKTREFLGSGNITSNGIATLKQGDWEALRNLSDDTSSLLLVCKLEK